MRKARTTRSRTQLPHLEPPYARWTVFLGRERVAYSRGRRAGICNEELLARMLPVYLQQFHQSAHPAKVECREEQPCFVAWPFSRQVELPVVENRPVLLMLNPCRFC